MQGCGLKQREAQPRVARLPLSEARAPSHAEPDPKGPSLPLLPIPIFAQPEQYQSKVYVTAARAPDGRSKAQARTIRTGLDAERRLLGKKLTCRRANRQGKDDRIKPDAKRKIDEGIPRRI